VAEVEQGSEAADAAESEAESGGAAREAADDAREPETENGDGTAGSRAVLTVERLEVDFGTKEGVVHAVRGIDFELQIGEVLGIVGESGSGKSVTALATMGLLPKSADVRGSIKFKERELVGLKEKHLTGVRGTGVSMIFQDPMTSLNPVYTIGWQIAEAILAHQEVSKEDAWKRSVELLRKVGIPFPEERINNYPHEFSGGMRQRAVIAIAMANDPEVILADEPTTALDVTVQAQVLDSLKTALSETGAALLLITHDLGVIAGLADQVLVMYAGRPVEVGTVEDIFYRPSTIGLLGSLPRLDAEGRERLRQIPGAPPSILGDRVGCPFAPRCPLAQDVCRETEPDLQVVESVTSASGQHRAACHFAEEVGRGDHGKIFSDGVVDNVVV